MPGVFLSRFFVAVGFLSAVFVPPAGTFSSPIAKGKPDEQPRSGAKPPIPDTWDEARLASLQVPLAHAPVSPQHVSREYYTSLPVRPIYKSYDVYRPDREPQGYFEWLQKQEPEVVWDEKT